MMNEATVFHDKEIPQENSNYTSLEVILTDFVLRKDENCYS